MPRPRLLTGLLAALAAAVSLAPLSAAPFLYATRPTTGSVVAIDLATGALAADLAAGTFPAGAVFDPAGERLFVADSAAGAVEVFDTTAGHLATIPVGAGAAGLCAEPGGDRVFVAAAQDDAVVVLDAQTLAVAGTAVVGDAPAAVACDLVWVVVANFGGGSVSILDAAIGAPLATVPVGAFPAGVALALGRAFVADLGDDTVSVVDLATQTVVGTVPVGDAPRGIAAGGGRVFVGNVNDGTVTVLDAATLLTVTTIALPLAGPFDLALSSGGEALYVAHLAGPSVTVIDTGALAVQGSIATGEGLLALAGVAPGVPAGGGAGVLGIPALGGPGLAALAGLLAGSGWLVLGRLRRGGRGRGGLLSSILLLAAAAPAARAGTVTFSDALFLPADWTVFSAEVGDGAQEVMQDATAGNPAPCRWMQHESPPPSGGPEEVVEVVHLYAVATYDPAAGGAVAALDAAWDRIIADVDGGDGQVEEAFAVEQGETVYLTSVETFSSPAWSTVSRTGLAAVDFADEGGAHPDFSAGGAPLALGYLRRTRNATPSFEFIVHLIDNWSVTVHTGAGGAGTAGFASPAFAVAGDDAASIGVVRSGDPGGAAAVDVVLFPPASPPVVRTASWGDGEAGLVEVEFQAAEIGATDDLVILGLALEDPTPGLTLDPQRAQAQLLASQDPALVQLALVLQLLLSRFDAATVVALAIFAFLLVARRRAAARALSGAALWPGLLIAGVLSPACVPTGEVVVKYTSARFNERVRADLNPLTCKDRLTDLRYGFFRDGSNGGLVNEIFPVAASDPTGPGNLVLTDCLFVGSEGSSGDELRLSWEVVGKIDRSVEPLDKIFRPCGEGDSDCHLDELGFCTFSSPVSRLLAEKPGEEAGGELEGRLCGQGGAWVATLPRDPEQWHNILIRCRAGGGLFARLEAHSTALPDDPDALCPVDHFDGAATSLQARVDGFSCLGEGELLDACAVPCGLEPRGDVSYRVRVASEELGVPDDAMDGDKRWLEPDILLVEGSRPMVRPMARDGETLRFVWQTAVTPFVPPPGVPDSSCLPMPLPVRWGENFAPTVRVDSVQILTRDAAGVEEVVETDMNRLTIRIPEPGVAHPRTLTCTGSKHDGSHLSFWVHPTDNQTSDCTFEPQPLRILTPTYAVSYLHVDPPVTRPITWEATLLEDPMGKQVFIRFFLRFEATPAAVRMSPAVLDFGELQEDEWREGELTLTNVGGEMLEIRSVGWAPGSAHPGDFTFYVAGDPVPMPLPIEAKMGPAGVLALRLAADAGEAPILSLEQTSTDLRIALGAPDDSGEPQPLTLYGEGATLVGSLLLRHDPGAVFEPAAPGDPRPFVLPAHAEARPPFVLSPGESVTIRVQARPGAIGQRSAGLAVEAVSLVNPAFSQTVVAQLVADSLSGPQLHALPPALWVKRDSASDFPEPRRYALLENVGHFDLEVQQLDLAGSGASRFTVESDRGLPPFVLPPGESSDLVIRYLPACDGTYTLPDHEARLLVASNGGAAEIPLFGLSHGYCELP